MLICHLYITAVKLSRFTFSVHHAESFRDLTTVAHLLVILDKVTGLFILVKHFINLDDFVSILVFAHCIVQGFLANCEMVF